MNHYPLFALPLVACPRELVPLHIFEPRYKAMIAHCLEEQSQGKAGEFILACSSGSIIKKVATVVKLLKVLKKYDDGRMDVVALGRRRVRLGDLEQEKPYPVVEAVFLDDEARDWDETLANEAFTNHRALIQMITGNQPDEKMYAGVSDLSFLMASSICMDIESKQAIIESRSEDERLKLVNRIMQQLIVQVEAVQQIARAMQGYWDLQKVFGSGKL